MMQHGLVALRLMLSLGLRPRDNIQPSGNITMLHHFLGNNYYLVQSVCLDVGERRLEVERTFYGCGLLARMTSRLHVIVDKIS